MEAIVIMITKKATLFSPLRHSFSLFLFRISCYITLNRRRYRSYPHGGRVSAFLLLSMLCGVVCTCYSISSCRIVTLDYRSQMGDFDQHFSDRDPEEEYAVYRVGVGLFTWHRPFDTLDWESGACAGYNQLQREVIIDQLFELIRVAGILAVVMGVSCFFFSLSIACLSFSNIQRYIMVITAIIMSALTGTALMITRSGVCTRVGENPNCSIDRGGLVAIAGVICWMLTSLVAIFFVQPVHRKKLSPRMAEKRRKERIQRQLDMIQKLEAIELEKHLQLRRTMKNKRNRSEHSESTDLSTPPSSPTRQPPTSPESSPREIIHYLPSDQRKESLPPPQITRKHKQMESPQVSPIRPQSQHCHQSSQSATGDYQVTEHGEVETIYRERTRPVKKRRLRGDSQKALVANHSVLSKGRSRGVYNSSSGVYAKNAERTKTNTLQHIHNRKNPPQDPLGDEHQLVLPVFLSRDVSSVVNERAVNHDVSVFIAGALDKIDGIIDDDEENAIDRSNRLYEL